MKLEKKEFPLLSFFNFFSKPEIACNDGEGRRERRDWAYILQNIHSFSIFSYERSKASSKASSPHGAV
jgi:hypothetical protein